METVTLQGFLEKKTTVDGSVGFFCTARRAAKTEKWLN